ncbi:MAG TPA: hypothetical protein VFQ74_03395 [Pseudolysinimonas sp.]|nr:hypothetical protein [Pseudolysinimonas sp.]
MEAEKRRGFAHIVLSFVTLTFLIYGTLFATNVPGFESYEPIILPLLEFGSAIAGGVIGGIAYWLRGRIERRSPTQRPRWTLALLLGVASGIVWFLNLWYWNTALPLWASAALGLVAAGMSMTLFDVLPPGALRSIPPRIAFVRAAGFTAASFGVALGLPWMLPLLFPVASA